jgi:hypothetical protein
MKVVRLSALRTGRLYLIIIIVIIIIIIIIFSSIGATARCGLWPVEQYLSVFPYLSPILSIFSLPTLEDLFLPLLPIISWVFLYVLPLPAGAFTPRKYS